jgi:hypothetical protein
MKIIFSKKTAAITIILLIVVAVGFLILKTVTKPIIEPVEVLISDPRVETIGRTVEGRDIVAYTYGTGQKHLAFVGGIHGGYEWNSVLLAYQAIDYLTANPQIIPKNITVTIIPNANPDGVYKVTGKDGRFTVTDVKNNLPVGTGRFNAHGVDLNRNFACQWQSTSTWRENIVSGGATVFSEPEAVAIRDFVAKNNPSAMVFWHSQSNAVYASQCGNGILLGTRDIMNLYSKSANYPAVDVFDSYVVTGAVEDWLASIGVPAITVELKTHETIEWDKNLAGMKALFEYFGNK